MIKPLFNIVLILAVVFGNKHHKHKSKSVHLPQNHVVQQGKWEPNREGGFHAKSSVCTSHFCYDSIRDETCDSTSTVCDDNVAFLHLGKKSRSLLQETESCSEAEGCGCLETADTSYHCLEEKECDSDTTTDECSSNSDCEVGEYCADACCGYNQCLVLCCDSTTEEPIATTEEATTDEPTTSEPTTAEPTTAEPTTAEPTTAEPTTAEPTTSEPTTSEPTTSEPTTAEPTTAQPTNTPEPTTDEYPETTSDEYPETTSDEYPETTSRDGSKLMNAHSIHKHGGEDDKPEFAPPQPVEEPPQTADEDGVEPPPAVQNSLLARLSKKSGQPQPIAGSPQEANEDGVEPPPAVEEEPEFSMSKKKKQRRKKKFGSVAAPPQPVEEPPQTADEDGVEPPPAVEAQPNDDDDDDSDGDDSDDGDNDDTKFSAHNDKHRKSNVFPLVYFAPFLLVATIVGIAFLVKFYFDRNVYKNKLLSVDERNENVPLISKVATYQATN